MESNSKKSESWRDWTNKKWRACLRFLKRQRVLMPDHIISVWGIIIVSALLTLAIVGKNTSLPELARGGIITQDVIAPRDFTVENVDATENQREQSASQVYPIFDYDPQISKQAFSQLDGELKLLMTKRPLKPLITGDVATTTDSVNEPPTTSPDKTTPKILSNGFCITILAARNFDPQLCRELSDALSNVLNGYIYPAGDIEQTNVRRVTVKNLATGEKVELRGRDIISEKAAVKMLEDEINLIRGLSLTEREQVTGALRPFIAPNLRYDKLATDQARLEARQKVKSISIDFRRNQIVARRGDPITPFNERVLETIQTIEQSNSYFRLAVQFIGLFMFILGMIFAIRRFAQRSSSRHRLGTARTFSVICVTLVLQAFLIRLGISMSAETMLNWGGLSRTEFLIPFASAALIVSLLVDTIAAQICALLVCVITAIITKGDVGLVLYSLFSGMAATYSIERYRQRNSITRAALIIAAVNILAAVVVILVGNQPADLGVYLYDIIYSIGGGLLTAAFVSMLIPVNESIFDILTDVKLLELGNMDLPLLRDLAIQAPGTQQHSMMVGSLAEAAAEAIGANALLVRVGCYYHDIGKMMAPEMFIENQAGGPNPHDIMDPKRSASVITGHVRKGILMGQEAGLPTQIIDLIPQHHGTRKLHYFYNKALEQFSQSGEPINENHYRYPGPKPQTREAAILMLADCSEAAARTLDEQTPENVRAIIKKITEDIIADGQLDECEMTMNEFNKVRESLIHTLCNIYHNRIKYPGFNEEEEESLAPATMAEPLKQVATHHAK
jgi:putative nucleotidyltransferase with HDIG domain